MGSPKYLLNTPIMPLTTVPLIVKTIMIHQICQDSYRDVLCRTTSVSVRDSIQIEELDSLLAKSMVNHDQVHYIPDRIPDSGPASGLILAHEDDTDAHWLVTGCDYPLLKPQTLALLIESHLKEKKAITCFRNTNGFNEPLLGIWSPTALRRLQELGMKNPAIGPNRVIQEFASNPDNAIHAKDYCSGVKIVTPPDQAWLRSVNTREEWEAVQPHIPEFSQWSKFTRQFS